MNVQIYNIYNRRKVKIVLSQVISKKRQGMVKKKKIVFRRRLYVELVEYIMELLKYGNEKKSPRYCQILKRKLNSI